MLTSDSFSPMVEIYVSTDVETDGPVPGLHSMLSFASAAYLADKTQIGTFSANLEILPGASGHAETMDWWKTQPVAWAACRLDPRSPELAMHEYVAWLNRLPGRPIFVGYPVVFDYMFIQWYLHRFTGGSPFSFYGLDVKTYAMSILKKDYYDTTKAVMPRRWFDDLKHTHLALEDAKEQGALFCNMLMENTK